jgi:hypothetical protein
VHAAKYEARGRLLPVGTIPPAQLGKALIHLGCDVGSRQLWYQFCWQRLAVKHLPLAARVAKAAWPVYVEIADGAEHDCVLCDGASPVAAGIVQVTGNQMQAECLFQFDHR